jgi:REP element-mobilizing transposase RayT
MKQEMKEPPFYLNKEERVCVLKSIKEVCDFRGYELHAVNIRTNHLHAVISGQVQPEKIVNDFKFYATRNLRSANLIDKSRTVWARGKSGKYLWKRRHVEIAVDYVLFGQGDEIPEFD